MHSDGQLWAVEIPCPCCRETLLRSIVSEGMAQPMCDFPAVKQDDRGYYMRCGSCLRRVSIDLHDDVPGAPARLRIADRQDCAPLGGE
jgi:hypothetical protein